MNRLERIRAFKESMSTSYTDQWQDLNTARLEEDASDDLDMTLVEYVAKEISESKDWIERIDAEVYDLVRHLHHAVIPNGAEEEYAKILVELRDKYHNITQLAMDLDSIVSDLDEFSATNLTGRYEDA